MTHPDTCPNETGHSGNCHLCAHLPNGCFLRDVLQQAPTSPLPGPSLPPTETHD
jgi:hypothetical protein